MKTIAEIKNNVEEYHDKPWFAIGLLVGGFETDEIRRKAPQVYHAIYKKVAFDEGTFGKMLVFLGKEGMKEEEQEKLRSWLKEWVPVEEGDEDAKYWFLSGFVNGQVEIHQQEWISFSEAAEKWGLGESTLRSAVNRGRFHENEIRKSGKVWLVTRQGIERLYGKIE